MVSRTSEHQEQSRFFAVIRRMAEKDHRLQGAFAIPNGFLDSKSKRVRAWQEGTLSGVPDIFIPWPSRGHHGLFLEFKALGGTVSKAQKVFLALASSRGYKAQVVFGLREALEALKDYLEGEGEGLEGPKGEGPRGEGPNAKGPLTLPKAKAQGPRAPDGDL